MFNRPNNVRLSCQVIAENGAGQTPSDPFDLTPRATAGLALNLEGALITAFDDASLAGLNDQDAQTPWASTRAQTVGDWLQVDLGQPMALNRITVDSICRPTNAATALAVMISNDGRSWSELARWSGSDVRAEVTFTSTSSQFWRIVIAAPHPAAWAVCALYLSPS